MGVSERCAAAAPAQDAPPVSLPSALAVHARERPGQAAVAMPGFSCTYAELWSRIERATRRLAVAFGIGSGDRVAYLGLNQTDEIVLLSALMRLGAIFVPLNYRLAAAELSAIVAHAGASLLFHDDHFARLAGEVINAEVRLAQHPLSVLCDGEVDARRAIESAAEDETPALLVYTSGTTGEPKGAVHTHAGLHANALASIVHHELSPEDRVLTVLPLFHVGGLCIQTVPALFAGATVHLHPRFDPAAWLDAVGRDRPTLSLLVPATMRALLEHPQWHAADLRSLRSIGAGSSTIPDPLIEGFHARGIPICQIYGATETGPVSIVLAREEAFANVGAAGRPALGCEIRLVGERGDDVPPGTTGEVWVKGPNVMRGYWRETAHPAFDGGWFHTGDLGRVDARGLYTIAGRSQDLIISGGENIHPAELENILAAMPEVAEAAVVGMPDERWGEVPVAAIVLRPGASLTADEVRRRFEGRLARFKHPHQVFFRDALPRNAMGKVVNARLLAALV